MDNRSSNGSSLNKRNIVWIVNIAVAFLCVLSVVCYFFGAVWKLDLTYTLTAEQIEKLSGESGLELDAKDIVGEEGEKISLSLSLDAGHVLGSFASAEATVDKILDSNVDKIAAQLNEDMKGLAHKAVKSGAKNIVKNQVKDNVKKLLSNDENEASNEEVQQKLDELGFTDEYISEKTDKIVDGVFAGGSDVDTITDNIMDTVDEVYSDFQKNSQGKEGFEEFQDAELSEEDRAQIEDSVRDTLEQLAAEDGSIDPDELVAEMLAKMLGGDTEGEGSVRGGIALLAAEESSSVSGVDKLASVLKTTLNDLIPDEVRTILVYVFYGMAGIMLFSMLPWVYILIKLLVKLLAKSSDPTVKLALPIWLGWLFFLLFALLPTVALWIVKMPSVAAMIAGAMPEFGTMLGQLSFSVSSIAWISALCALLVFGISIYYMVVRKQLKKEPLEPQTPQEPQGPVEPEKSDDTPLTDMHEEVAVAEE